MKRAGRRMGRAARQCGMTALLASICAGGASVAGAQTGHEDHGLRADDHGNGVAVQRAPLYTHDDLIFLQHMIVHHQQALDMAALVPDRSDRPQLMRFARYIAGAQAAEIAAMRELLDLAAERGQALPAHDHISADPPMDGMLSSAQMQALAAATGAAFERLWLEGMIYHHQGAIDMATAQQLRQLQDNRRPYGLHMLVEDMLLEQRAEIHRMQQWLQQWELTTDAGDEEP